MKEVKQYKCEYCGTLYADKSECAACEKQHAVPCKIVAVHHRAKGVCAVYPPRIDVGFSDGSVQHYTLYRPPMPGSIPKGAIAVSTWGSRPFIPEINRSAWGTVDYSRQLTPEEMRNYELMPANVVQQPIEMEG